MKKLVHRVRREAAVPWDISNLETNPIVRLLFVILNVAFTFVYGFSLLVYGTTIPAGPLIYLVSLLSLPAWGMLALLVLLLFIVGLILRRNLLVSLGTLFCSSVWVGIATCAVAGAIGLGGGFLIAFPYVYLAVTWLLYFWMNTRKINMPGG